MKYCPACKKPSALTSGPCPHCGADLGGRGGPGQSTAAGGSPMPGAAPVQQDAAFGGADLELQTDGDEPELLLETESENVPVLPAAAPPVLAVRKEPAEISDAEVHMLAGFGQPEDGLVGKIRYSFRVRARLKVLRPQFEQATQEREAAWNRLEQAKAALGRDVARADAAGENLTVLIRKASMADEALQGAQTAEQSLNAAYEQKNAAIDARINALEQEAAPIRQEEALARAAHEEAQTDCRRATARVKRTEIELRNLREKIAVRQKDYADLKRPAEERQRLLAEISKLDLEGQPVVARLAQQNAEATALEGPLQARSKVLGDAMARLAQKNEQIAGCRREKDALTRDHQIALDAAREKTRGESAESTRVWSLVGEQAYLTGLHRAHPSLAPSGNALEECRLAFLTASRLQELHERAIGAFNTEVCTQANRLMLIAGVSLVVVLAILLTVFS